MMMLSSWMEFLTSPNVVEFQSTVHFSSFRQVVLYDMMCLLIISLTKVQEPNANSHRYVQQSKNYRDDVNAEQKCNFWSNWIQNILYLADKLSQFTTEWFVSIYISGVQG